MIEFPAKYYDGVTTRSRAVVVRLDEQNVVHLAGLETPASFPLADVEVSPPLGSTPRSLTLPDGAKCETDDQAALAVLEQKAGKGRVNARLHALESNWRGALLAAAVLVVLVSAGIRWGIPLLAERVAQSVPKAMAYDLGQGTLGVLDNTLLKPSALSTERKAQLQLAFSHMARLYPALPLKLTFRRANMPNAFALPDGTVLVTDELVALAKNDNEILSVLAHEIGHVHRRHALRMALESSTAVLLASAYLGDVSQLTTLSVALPTVYTQAHYSRAHETEADTFALETLKACGIPPEHFAHILQALQKSSGAEFEHGLQYLSSHPPTPERIRRFEPR